MAAPAPTEDRTAHGRPVTSVRRDVANIPGKYLSITSFRRDGTGVATPVWFVVESGRLLVITDADSGKVKRIHRNPFVTAAPCSARGRLRADAIPAHAEIQPPSEVERVKRLIARKYRFDLLYVRPIRALQALFHPELRDQHEVIVAITPDARP